jgi:uncharacterized membrane protein YidH (DUF202 family)
MSDSLKIRLAALLFISTGITLLVLYLSGYKPAFLQIPVFAVASTYAQNRFFQLVETNAIDEIGFLFIAVGLSFLVWNTFKERDVERQLKAFKFALKYTFIFAFLAYVLIFGYAIFGVLMALFPVFIVLYLIKFELLRRKV